MCTVWRPSYVKCKSRPPVRRAASNLSYSVLTVASSCRWASYPTGRLCCLPHPSRQPTDHPRATSQQNRYRSYRLMRPLSLSCSKDQTLPSMSTTACSDRPCATNSCRNSSRQKQERRLRPLPRSTTRSRTNRPDQGCAHFCSMGLCTSLRPPHELGQQRLQHAKCSRENPLPVSRTRFLLSSLTVKMGMKKRRTRKRAPAKGFKKSELGSLRGDFGSRCDLTLMTPAQNANRLDDHERGKTGLVDRPRPSRP